jgi:hypothetical protein
MRGTMVRSTQLKPLVFEAVPLWLVHSLTTSRLVPILVGLVLLTAAFFKAHELATEELSETSLLTSRWFLTLLVLYEVGLGVCLLGGLAPATTRWIALITFVAFFEVALFQAVMGYGSCRCLGKVVLNPWYTVLFDSAAIAALLAWQPERGWPAITSTARRLAWIALIFVSIAFPVVLNIVYYAPTGIMHSLRRDERLRVRLELKESKPQLQVLLDELAKRTGLVIMAAEPLHEHQPDFGIIQLTGTPAWAVMEHVAKKQVVPARWDKVDGGYELRAAAPWASYWDPWVLSGVLLAGAALVWRLFGLTGRSQTLR